MPFSAWFCFTSFCFILDCIFTFFVFFIRDVILKNRSHDKIYLSVLTNNLNNVISQWVKNKKPGPSNETNRIRKKVSHFKIIAITEFQK